MPETIETILSGTEDAMRKAVNHLEAELVKVRAGKANLFLSDVFTQTFSAVNGVAVEFYNGDGSFGAAIGAGIGSGIYSSAKDASGSRKPVATIIPATDARYEELYEEWKELLDQRLKKINKTTALSLSLS